MDQNPASGTMPARASEPMTNVQNVYGMCLRSPPMSDMLLECTEWITDPAPRNSSDLKKAWVNRWKSPAVYAPAPMAVIM